MLLEHGADLEATDDHRRTPLHVASSWGDSGLVQMLVMKFRANTGALNTEGHTPSDVAATRAVRQAFVIAGAKSTLEDPYTAHETSRITLPKLEDAVRHERATLGAGSTGHKGGGPSVARTHSLHVEETIVECDEEFSSRAVRARSA